MNLRLATILYFVLVILLLIAGYAYAADNKIIVDQIGSSNTIVIEQVGKGHQATVAVALVGTHNLPDIIIP
jgi:hypothetical protein